MTLTALDVRLSPWLRSCTVAPLASARNVPARLVYRLDVNHYRDARTAQLVVEHLESV